MDNKLTCFEDGKNNSDALLPVVEVAVDVEKRSSVTLHINMRNKADRRVEREVFLKYSTTELFLRYLTVSVGVKDRELIDISM